MKLILMFVFMNCILFRVQKFGWYCERLELCKTKTKKGKHPVVKGSGIVQLA
jgi:hypothetical protein